MSYTIETDVETLADKLAEHLRTNRTGAIRTALENELKRLEDGAPLRARLEPLFQRIAARPRGPDADKAFFDELSGT